MRRAPRSSGSISGVNQIASVCSSTGFAHSGSKSPYHPGIVTRPVRRLSAAGRTSVAIVRTACFVIVDIESPAIAGERLPKVSVGGTVRQQNGELTAGVLVGQGSERSSTEANVSAWFTRRRTSTIYRGDALIDTREDRHGDCSRRRGDLQEAANCRETPGTSRRSLQRLSRSPVGQERWSNIPHLRKP